MKKLLFSLISLVFAFGAQSQVRFIQANSLEDYETVLKTVDQQEKLICLAVHEDQGAFRQMYFDGVFNDPQLKALGSLYTNIAVNIDGEMGNRLSEVFEFGELPTFMVLNKDEFVLAKLEGYQSASTLNQVLRSSAANPYQYDSLLLAYQAHNLTDAEWIKLLDLYALNFDFNSTSLLALEYLNSLSADALLRKPGVEILSAYGVDLETPYPELVIANASSIKKILPAFDQKDFMAQAMTYNLDLAVSNKDSELFTKALNLFVKSPYVPIDSLESYREAYQLAYAEASEDYSLYAQMIMDRSDALAPSLAANLLFDQAYEITQEHNQGSSLEGAYLLASYSNEKNNSFRARMLKAYIQYLLENEEQARMDLKEAKSLISNPEELKSANKLEALIDE